MKRTNQLNILCVSIIVALTLFLLNIITGQLFASNPYNSYMLQAQSWLSGRLDLGRDYPHLELAIFEGKYFVSFPPFPSYMMLPFAVIGFERADMLLTLIFSLLSGIYAVKISDMFSKSAAQSLFWGLFITIGSNWLTNACVPWVWFIAQNMAFALSMMSIYYAIKGKAGLSLTCWACAVGCRPFQIIYIFVILYLLIGEYKKQGLSLVGILKSKWYCAIAPFIIALSYMILNYARFGSVFEFGHNYLPEFMRVSTGQFNIAYLRENILSLFRFPLTHDNGKLAFIQHNGFCIFVASPVFVSYIIYFVRSLIKGDSDKKLNILIFILILIHLFAITMHKTMGGAHYGNRYTNDILPFLFLSLVNMDSKNIRKLDFWLFIIGFALNVCWVIMYF